MKLIYCGICNKEIHRKRPDSRTKIYTCSKECMHQVKLKMNLKEVIIKPCMNCGKPARIPFHRKDKNGCCSVECTRKYSSTKLSALNRKLNPDRMIPETREKLREANLGKGEGKAYRKTYGRHTHRIVAEEKIGRPLKKGEVVHHLDGNKLNNHPDNIPVLESQAEHARIHFTKKK